MPRARAPQGLVREIRADDLCAQPGQPLRQHAGAAIHLQDAIAGLDIPHEQALAALVEGITLLAPI